MTSYDSYRGHGARRRRTLERAAKAAMAGAGPYSKMAAPASSSRAVHSKAAAMIHAGVLQPPPPPKASWASPAPKADGAAPPPKASWASPVPKADGAAPIAACAAPPAPVIAHHQGQRPPLAVGSGVISCRVDRKLSVNIAQVTFASNTLAQLFCSRPPSIFTRVERPIEDASMVYMTWPDDTQFDQTTLEAFLANWVHGPAV